MQPQLLPLAHNGPWGPAARGARRRQSCWPQAKPDGKPPPQQLWRLPKGWLSPRRQLCTECSQCLLRPLRPWLLVQGASLRRPRP